MPLFPLSPKRNIQYPLDEQLVGTAITPIGETATDPFVWPVSDPDEIVTITMELSLNQYVALASAVDVGRDIAYGTASLNIWWIWLRSTNAVAFCDQLDDCIENNPSTITIINNTISQSGVINPDQIDPTSPEMDNRFPPSERTASPNPPPVGCDKDELWAGILEVVTRLDGMGRDFLESVVSNTDAAERIADIIDLVPLAGDIIADIITLFSETSPDLLNAYNAHSSQVVIEETACALFELVCNECRYPTYDEYINEYTSAGVSGMDDISAYGVTALMDYMTASNLLGQSVVWYTMNASVLNILFLGGSWNGFRGLKWLQIWANIGADNPSNGWELLCDGCETVWCQTFDFTVEDHGFVGLPFGSSPSAVLWVSGQGLRSVDTGPDYTMLGELQFTETTLTEVEIKVQWGAGVVNSNITLYGKKADDNSDVLATNGAPTPNIIYTLNWVGLAAYKAIPVWLANSNGDQQYLFEMTIKGIGTSPFGADNC